MRPDIKALSNAKDVENNANTYVIAQGGRTMLDGQHNAAMESIEIGLYMDP